MSTYDRAKYLKYKKTQIEANHRWQAKQPEEYQEYLRAIVRKSTAKHYENNREKILAYKKRYTGMKKEIQSLMNLYAVYE